MPDRQKLVGVIFSGNYIPVVTIRLVHGGRHEHYYLDCDMHYHRTNMTQFDTKDREIRQELVCRLELAYKDDPEHMIVEELGINHGSVRADVAVINGIWIATR